MLPAGEHDYRQHWRRHRDLNESQFATLLGFVPVVGSFGFIPARLFGTLVPAFVLAGV
jgi:hypothetical protein